MRRICAPFLLMIMGLLPLFAGAATREESLEYPVKAAFLTKFGEFVTWPEESFPGPDDPVAVCVMGPDPFGAHLDRIAETQTVGQRPITIRRMAPPDEASDCHILYLSTEREDAIHDMLRRLAGKPVLTVTDAANAGDARGVVHFVIRDNRVRFHIDSGTAARNGLTISSKLLSLALTVTKRG